MDCEDLKSCFSEINAYCNGQNTGKALLVNTENYDTYQQIKATLEADNTKSFIYVSLTCSDSGLPDLEEIINSTSGPNCNVIVGLSQAAMLRSSEYMDKLIGLLLEKPVRGHMVVLLDHSEQYLKKYFSVHPDIHKRVVLNKDSASEIPRIRLVGDSADCINRSPLPNIKCLIAYFEQLTNTLAEKNKEVFVTTHYSPKLFSNAVYSVSSCDSLYDYLKKEYPEVAAGTEDFYGTKEQWRFLAQQLQNLGSISAVTENVFGSTSNLQSHIGEVLAEEDNDKLWLLWLSLKLFGATGNKYLSIVMQHSKNVSDVEEHIYLDLLNFKHDEADFHQHYIERKLLIGLLPENLVLLDKYCDKIGIHGRNSVYYLTDASEKEKYIFMQCLATYNYTEAELLKITKDSFPVLNCYLLPFTFDSTNIKLPETEAHLRDELTHYFHQYKLQKLTNRIYPEFMTQIESYAKSRPYNKLQARSTVVRQLNRKNAQLFFFDALGVEYLAYILTRCEKYNLIAEISVAQCALPSITSKNKEFIQFFSGKVNNIKELDELKHHSQIIDYEQCKYPIHLFRELEIIDSELKKIQSKLKQGIFEKAIIISDHGASRLAVIHEQETDLLELEEKGQHSGRCCPAESDPNIPYASYWDGYSVLANYDRFKGSRKANVEVHGGASLEEVIVPIITLTNKPLDIDIRFVNSVIELKGKEPATITIYANIPLHEPKLVVNGKIYIGEFADDNRHAKFIMPEFKRSRDWIADFYDGDKKMASRLAFRVQRKSKEQSLLKKMPF